MAQLEPEMAVHVNHLKTVFNSCGFCCCCCILFIWNTEFILLCDQSSTIVNERERRGMHEKEDYSFQSLLGLKGDLIRQRIQEEHSLCPSFH